MIKLGDYDESKHLSTKTVDSSKISPKLSNFPSPEQVAEEKPDGVLKVEDESNKS